MSRSWSIPNWGLPNQGLSNKELLNQGIPTQGCPKPVALKLGHPNLGHPEPGSGRQAPAPRRESIYCTRRVLFTDAFCFLKGDYFGGAGGSPHTKVYAIRDSSSQLLYAGAAAAPPVVSIKDT